MKTHRRKQAQPRDLGCFVEIHLSSVIKFQTRQTFLIQTFAA